jgi:hypothetical protein
LLWDLLEGGRRERDIERERGRNTYIYVYVYAYVYIVKGRKQEGGVEVGI